MKTLSFKTVLFAAVATVGLGLRLAGPVHQVAAQEVGVRQEPKSKAVAQANAPRVSTAPRNLTATPGRGEAVLVEVDERGNRIVEFDIIPPRRAKAGRLALRPIRVARTYKESTHSLRWAVVVGTLDFRTIRESCLGKDGRNAEREHQLCKRIDLQRQTRNPDGTWTDWNDIDCDANYKVLDNITEVAKERTKPDVYLEAVVDPLPLLKSGEWRGVDVPAFFDPNAEKAPTIFGFPVGHAPLSLPADEIMVRCLDFTVHPEASYRYRSRVVLWDYKTQRGDLFGPWSEPTAAVAIPKD
jgi:hypothetical protein